jgi:NADPH:quinone reductase-like Zn-dependent oxidoreductase
MLAAFVRRPSPDDPLAALVLGPRPQPRPRPGWVRVTMRAASLNMHDICGLRGVRPHPESYPMILGCDGAGITDDGREVVVHSSVASAGWVGPETEDPDRTVLSQRHPGTFAEQVVVPARNAIAKPAALSFEEAACLPTAWLTAYRMLFVSAGIGPGARILVDGRDRLGSISAAAVRLGAAVGCEVWATARPRHRAWASALGAHAVFDVDETLPGQVDAVIDAGTGETNWTYLLDAVRPGGALVCGGWRFWPPRTDYPPDLLEKFIFAERRLVGSSLGAVEDLRALLTLLDRTGLRPDIAMTMPLGEARRGIEAMLTGRVHGKIVFTDS